MRCHICEYKHTLCNEVTPSNLLKSLSLTHSLFLSLISAGNKPRILCMLDKLSLSNPKSPFFLQHIVADIQILEQNMHKHRVTWTTLPCIHLDKNTSLPIQCEMCFGLFIRLSLRQISKCPWLQIIKSTLAGIRRKSFIVHVQEVKVPGQIQIRLVCCIAQKNPNTARDFPREQSTNPGEHAGTQSDAPNLADAPEEIVPY